MLENLLDLVKQEAQNVIVTNPAVPNSQNNAVISDATNSVESGLKNALSTGGLQNIMSLFNSGGNNQSILSNPVVGAIISELTGKLTANHGVSTDQASGISSNLISNVISSLVSKTNDPNDHSFNVSGIISALTGGGAAAGTATTANDVEGDIISTIKNLF